MPGEQAQSLKVCFISPLGYGLYQPAAHLPFGGAEVQLYLLAQELSSHPGFTVSVLTTVAGTPDTEPHGRVSVIKRRAHGRLSPRQRAGIWTLISAMPGYVAAFADMLRVFRQIDAEVYVHAGAGVEVGAYALIARLLRRRFIYVVASSADIEAPYGLVTGPLRELYRLGVRLADRVVCRTTDQLAALSKSYGREGVQIRTGHPVPQPVSAQTAPRNILWVGRIHPLKQPEMFLDLVQARPTERYVMVAMQDRTHSALWKSVTERAARLPNLTFHENVPWDRIGESFNQAKLFVNTSTYEGFPNTFVQAAMAGVPILSWKVDPDGVLVQYRIGRCAGESFEELARLVQQLCEREDERIATGQRGRDYACRYHALEQVTADWQQLLSAMREKRSG